MSLESGLTWSATVNVGSGQQALPRVAPGNPDGSYLIHKIEGRGSISGSQMPRSAPPLSAGDIQRIRDWITAGAANN